MLTRSAVLRSQLPQLSRALIPSRRCSAELNPKVSVRHHEVRLSAPKEKQEQRLPFAKNFFVGKFDPEFAAFPVPQTTPRHGEFFEWLKPIENYVSTLDIGRIDSASQIPQEVLDNLKDLGVFRATVPAEYRGLGLNTSEFAKLVETLSAIPVLGTYLVKKRTAVDFIAGHASDAQKALYLPRIASGELSPTICITEDDEGASDTTISTHAKFSDCEQYFVLNGKKTFVFDARRANLFIVVSECNETGTGPRPVDTTSAFLVERSAEGITVSPPADTVGLRGLDLCAVAFNDMKIPRENLLGSIGEASRSFSKLFGEGRQYLGGQAIGITRKFVQLMIQHFKANKDFNALKFKNQVLQDVIGKTCGAIYGMESVVYLTCGMMDNFEEQDCDMEKCMVETFCAEECLQNIITGLQLVGVSSLVRDQLFQQFFRDAVALMSVEGTVLNTKVFVAMLGLQHTGDIVTDKVKIHRTPWNHPTYVLKKVFGYQHTSKLYISDNLHPSLKTTAETLEYGIGRLKECVEKVAIQYGREIFEKPATHKRIAEFASCLYVISATLARTNRSYCLGMRDADKEVYLTQIYGYILYERIKRLADQLEDSEWINGDYIIQEISDRAFEKNGYFLEHPLARNFS
ncbi:acyl-CoA dehydrogenase family member 9, mitochondrial [Diachasma alloeum]|uniref:acyl-CoA dehydrogenase family member 9, mitochondrial n=1 Tax=Diachasma alloeum TaxID=454923 RepID=UPI0007384B0F|nr:acyl-CoA dehydrogenase family member 9, mitochondrial [Diachasma alloeum]